jgi:hypothetical protein
MSWIYDRVKHTLSLPGRYTYTFCYSGNGEGLNNPAMEQVHMVGPLPADTYDMTEFTTGDRTGPGTIVLVARNLKPNFGRSLFRIHGDNAAANFTASDGCIILPGLVYRENVWDSGDRALNVI